MKLLDILEQICNLEESKKDKFSNVYLDKLNRNYLIEDKILLDDIYVFEENYISNINDTSDINKEKFTKQEDKEKILDKIKKDLKDGILSLSFNVKNVCKDLEISKDEVRKDLREILDIEECIKDELSKIFKDINICFDIFYMDMDNKDKKEINQEKINQEKIEEIIKNVCENLKISEFKRNILKKAIVEINERSEESKNRVINIYINLSPSLLEEENIEKIIEKEIKDSISSNVQVKLLHFCEYKSEKIDHSIEKLLKDKQEEIVKEISQNKIKNVNIYSRMPKNAEKMKHISLENINLKTSKSFVDVQIYNIEKINIDFEKYKDMSIEKDLSILILHVCDNVKNSKLMLIDKMQKIDEVEKNIIDEMENNHWYKMIVEGNFDSITNEEFPRVSAIFSISKKEEIKDENIKKELDKFRAKIITKKEIEKEMKKEASNKENNKSQKEDKEKDDTMLFGKLNLENKEIIDIKRVSEYSKNICVRVDITNIDSKKINQELMLLSFDAVDDNSAICCKKFLKVEEIDQIIENIEKHIKSGGQFIILADRKI